MWDEWSSIRREKNIFIFNQTIQVTHGARARARAKMLNNSYKVGNHMKQDYCFVWQIIISWLVIWSQMAF